ncbi:MAG: hypothetical protein Q8R30_04785 [bacterium]|nr:hypothetical protein [bacterium]
MFLTILLGMYITARVFINWARKKDEEGRRGVQYPSLNSVFKNEEEVHNVQRMVNRIFLGITGIVITIFIISAAETAITNRLPRADVDKAGSGVYQQMEDLQRKAQ